MKAKLLIASLGFISFSFAFAENSETQLPTSEVIIMEETVTPQNEEIDAPSFTLKDLEGKDVSLSDFRGKWVILDFWGSWCPWCIKGFPELKEAYEKYAGHLEIIGIDCRESEEAWKAGVEQYQLPWVNLYNPEGSSLLAEYEVKGFPTKVIVNPEGKIANVTIGHDPAFFTVLSSLLK
ncbi:MAG: redoxin domain-containing protein [Muribaculaceae bacterium]|nr:redoxin domain-containing protein [Muribaculaceae bacterium]